MPTAEQRQRAFDRWMTKHGDNLSAVAKVNLTDWIDHLQQELTDSESKVKALEISQDVWLTRFANAVNNYPTGDNIQKRDLIRIMEQL